jgi:hypothetical protein
MSETPVFSIMPKAEVAGWHHRQNIITTSKLLRKWISIILCIATLGVFYHTMLSSRTIAALATTLSLTSALPIPTGSESATLQQWQSSGSDNSAGHWLHELLDAVAVMQEPNYWTGFNWKSIQWISAFLNTELGATDRSLTEILVEHDGSLPDSSISAPTIDSEISKYYTEIRSFLNGEDTEQIFGAAYDDAQWVVLEWMEAIKFINEYDAYSNSSRSLDDVRSYAHRAHVFYNLVQNEFDTSTCGGGITWNPALEPYKNAITNELFMASSIAMYLYFPGDYNLDPYPTANYSSDTNTTLPSLPFMQPHDPLFLDNAIQEYAWFKTQNFTNAQGLIVDGFHISHGQTTCDQRNEMVYSYNQGVILSGLRGLWEATADPSYLADGYALIATVINATGWNAPDASRASGWAGLGRNGIMEDYCDAAANCSQDAQIFKGIYFHHLDLFCEPLPTVTPLVQGLTNLADSDLAAAHNDHCGSYAAWVTHNAEAALSTRDQYNVIGGWWGEKKNNEDDGSQSANLDMAVPLLPGSSDVINDPALLDQEPWTCGRRCREYAVGGGGGPSSGGATTLPYQALQKRQETRPSHTVETQGSGVGVVRAASDFMRRGLEETG